MQGSVESVGSVTAAPQVNASNSASTYLPLVVLVRPRSGDFCYDDGDLATMLHDIHAFKQLMRPADGFKFGCLTRFSFFF